MEIEEKIKTIIASILNVDLSVITSTLAVGDIDEWDSMGNVAILSAIEDEFQIDIPMEDLFELTSVDAIVNKIKELKYA